MEALALTRLRAIARSGSHYRPANDAAGDFLSRVSCRLGGKIIGSFMDDDGFADDIIHTEAAGENGHFGFSLTGQQGGQISGMARVELTGGIEMAAAFGKAPVSAAAAFVNMKGIKAVPR